MEDERIWWRKAQTDDDARALGPLLLVDMYQEVGRCELDPNKAFANIYACVKAGDAAMIFKGNTLIGSLGLVETKFWYSSELQCVEQWAYIVPQFRSSSALRCMFAAARSIAAERGYDSVYMLIFDPKTKGTSELSRVGERFDFRPAGSVIRLDEAAE